MRVSVEEKLAAILIADVADYERLIARDRAAAEAALQRQHHEVIDAAIAIYGGRIFELGAGRTSAEFTSPLAAVVGLLPFGLQLSVLLGQGLSFSPLQYAVGFYPPEVRVDRDVVLDPRSDPLLADVYHAPGPGPHPFVVLAHGGSWRGGERGEGAHLTRALAEKLLTYATGGAPAKSDRAEVEGIVATVRKKGYGFRTLAHEVVQSNLFQRK